MKKILTAAFLAAALAAPAFAQSSEKMEMARQMLVAMKSNTDGMAQSLEKATLGLGEKFPEYREKPEIFAAAAKVALDKHTPGFLKAIDERVNVYASELSEDELRAGTEYFASPLGVSTREKEAQWMRRENEGAARPALETLLTPEELAAYNAFHGGPGKNFKAVAAKATSTMMMPLITATLRITVTTELEFCKLVRTCTASRIARLLAIEKTVGP